MEKEKIITNPFLPGWEYIPDGEPHVFGSRVYLYGSHDRAHGTDYCQENYVCWSAPVDDLSLWRCEGEIYKKQQDPLNADGSRRLFAPDVAQGPDGRFYLYYCMWFYGYVSVAVADTPTGPFEYLGTVHNEDGSNITGGVRFDPAVISEKEGNFLYYGFCPTKHFPDMGPNPNLGSYMVELADDMVTAKTEPVCVAYGYEGMEGTGYEEHPFFEASSIRHIGNQYYFIYSSLQGHELCYGVAPTPRGPFEYKGVIISNADIGYRGNEIALNQKSNNHGSILTLEDSNYIFYHRHTNNTHFSRQACAEKIVFDEKGEIAQVEVTSCGLSEGALPNQGTYSAHIACNLLGIPERPYVTEETFATGEKNQYITNILEASQITVKYINFDADATSSITVAVRGGAGNVKIFLNHAERKLIGEQKIEASENWQDVNVLVKETVGERQALEFEFSSPAMIEFSEFKFNK